MQSLRNTASAECLCVCSKCRLMRMSPRLRAREHPSFVAFPIAFVVLPSQSFPMPLLLPLLPLTIHHSKSVSRFYLMLDGEDADAVVDGS